MSPVLVHLQRNNYNNLLKEELNCKNAYIHFDHFEKKDDKNVNGWLFCWDAFYKCHMSLSLQKANGLEILIGTFIVMLIIWITKMDVSVFAIQQL